MILTTDENEEIGIRSEPDGSMTVDGGHQGLAFVRLEIQAGRGPKVLKEYRGDRIEIVSHETMGGKRRQIHILIEEQRQQEPG